MAAVVAGSLGGFAPDGFEGIGAQLGTQAIASVFTIVFTAVVTFVILLIIKATVGLRVDEAAETVGLDQASHGETAYND